MIYKNKITQTKQDKGQNVMKLGQPSLHSHTHRGFCYDDVKSEHDFSTT